MKKAHLIILIITAIMALFSAYSLAAINQVYNIDFEWFSQYNNRFIKEKRDAAFDKWNLAGFPKDMQFAVIGENPNAGGKEPEDNNLEKSLKKVLASEDYSRYIIIYCTLGNVESPEYRVKFDDIAQRGNVVEVKVSMNSPPKDEINENNENEKADKKASYLPADIIRIPRNAFPTKGGLHFIFKTQSGKQVIEEYFEVD